MTSFQPSESPQVPGQHHVRLVDRSPHVAPEQLMASLVPPPMFAQVSFDTFTPNPAEPTQQAAVAALQVFAQKVAGGPDGEPRWWRRAPRPPEQRLGIYLDGGFGVGKTHLLASLFHQAPAPKLFATFVELTQLVGALGFGESVDRLATHRLVCIDEFELDDPGDTVLMSSLLTKLTERGVHLAATSNTLPDRLGEDRFAANDFLREIQSLAAHFDVVRIDGPDYRHRDASPALVSLSDSQLDELVAGTRGTVAVDTFAMLLEHLASLHPSRYAALVEGIEMVAWHDVSTIADQATALRFVVLVDRLYDRDVSVVASGVPMDQVFAPEMLTGGYRKKYFRALSRLAALTHLPPTV